jgi:hypothetical protein
MSQHGTMPIGRAGQMQRLANEMLGVAGPPNLGAGTGLGENARNGEQSGFPDGQPPVAPSRTTGPTGASGAPAVSGSGGC